MACFLTSLMPQCLYELKYQLSSVALTFTQSTWNIWSEFMEPLLNFAHTSCFYWVFIITRFYQGTLSHFMLCYSVKESVSIPYNNRLKCKDCKVITCRIDSFSFWLKTNLYNADFNKSLGSRSEERLGLRCGLL